MIRSLRVRVVAAVGVAVLAMAASQAVQGWQQEQISRNLTLVSKGYLPVAKVVGRLDNARERVAADVQRLASGDSRGSAGAGAVGRRLYVDQVARNVQEGHIHVAFARRLTDDPDEHDFLGQVDAQFDRIGQGFEDWQVDLDQRPDSAGGMARDSADLASEIDGLSRKVDGRVAELTRVTERAQARAAWLSAALTGVSLALSAVAVAAVLWALRPIGQLTRQVQRVALGDYSGRIEGKGVDEIGLLAREFDAMAAAIQVRDEALRQRNQELVQLGSYLRSVLDGLADGLWVVEEGVVTLANPAALDRFAVQRGFPPPERVGGLDLGRHDLHDRDRRFDIRVLPFGEKGRLVVASDVTDATRTRERLARSERLAAIGQMLAQITHEVRNPLNALSLNAELLGDELAALDPDRSRDAWTTLRTLSGEIDRLTRVTGHYLQLARRPKAVLEPEDLLELLRDVERLVRPELDEQGVSLSIVSSDTCVAEVDAGQVKQALLNLLRNAREAGATQLRVDLASAGADVRLQVEDDGSGMSDEQRARASEPFWTTKASGTGLGLAITRQIVEDHGGSVLIEPNVPRGTRVVLVLPRTGATSTATRP